MATKCTARSKQRGGAPCDAWAMKGRTVCITHGGRSRLGPGSGLYKDGRYSKFLPARMAADYQAAKDDSKLLELRDNIATVDARLIDLFKRVDSGEAGAIWKEAQAAMSRFRDAQAKNNVDAMMLAVTQAERLIGQGAGDYAAWSEIGGLIEQRRRLVDSEQK